MLVEMKVNGHPLRLDTAKLHPTWLDFCLAYGVKQKINDTYSGEKGQTKYDLCAAMIRDMESGEAMPERERKAPQAAKADPVRKMARDLATTFLTARFRAAFKTDDMSVWAKNDKAAKYLRFTEKGSARFDLAKVDEWIDAFAKQDGGQDFMAQAKAALAESQALADVALDDLGL